MVVTRSKSRQTQNAETNSTETKVIAKNTKKDWTENWAVMDKALSIFRAEVFSEKHKENDEFKSNRFGFAFKYAAKKEWESMPDSEKAPFIAKALEQLASYAPLWAFANRKLRGQNKRPRLSKTEMIIEAHQYITVEVVIEEYLRAHPGKDIPKEVFLAGSVREAHLSASERAAVYAILEKRQADAAEVYEHLLVDEAYAHIRRETGYCSS